jgi:LysR family transcriptional regulator for metE and metH
MGESMLERSHLEIIESLHCTGSLTRAAEELHLTQSALTHSIKKLESLSGAPIWEKEGRGLRLTDGGRLLLESAQRLLPQFRNIEDQLSRLGDGRLGKLTIGVECHPCYEWLIQVIHNYLEKCPEIDLDVTRNFQFDGLEALVNHKVNMLITPDYLFSDAVVHFEVFDFELQLMVASDHELALLDHIEPVDFNNQVLYTYPIGKERLDVFSLDIHPLKHIPIEATEIMVQLVAAGRGVSTFPDWLIQKYAPLCNVKGIPLTKRGIQKKLYIVVRREDAEIPYIRTFLDSATEEMRL